MLNCHIYLCLYIHIQAYGLGPFQVRFRKIKKCFLICHTYLWIKDKPSRCRENKQNKKPKTYSSFINHQLKSEAAEGKAQCYMWQSVVNTHTILVLSSTLCDVMSLLNKDYSENGTNVKANQIHLMKRELLAEIKKV